MILLIDNYDSFSYNLYQLIGSVDPDIKVIRNDEYTVEEIEAMKPEATDPFAGAGQTGRTQESASKRSDILQENFQSSESVWDIRQSVKLLAAEYPMQKN